MPQPSGWGLFLRCCEVNDLRQQPLASPTPPRRDRVQARPRSGRVADARRHRLFGSAGQSSKEGLNRPGQYWLAVAFSAGGDGACTRPRLRIAPHTAWARGSSSLPLLRACCCPPCCCGSRSLGCSTLLRYLLVRPTSHSRHRVACHEHRSSFGLAIRHLASSRANDVVFPLSWEPDLPMVFPNAVWSALLQANALFVSDYLQADHQWRKQALLLRRKTEKTSLILNYFHSSIGSGATPHPPRGRAGAAVGVSAVPQDGTRNPEMGPYLRSGW